MNFLSTLKKSVLILSACLVSSISVSHANDFPDRPITLLIPYPPGGSADILARPIAAQMQKDLGQSVILDYKPGAGGTIASSQLTRSKPDGYTVLMVLAAHAINPSLYQNLPYNTTEDFVPVTHLASLPLIVAASKKAKFDDIAGLIEYAKKNPGGVTYASAGNGNTSHLAVELFAMATDTSLLHIPYSGSGPAVVAMLSGEVDIMYDSISTSVVHVKDKKLKGLAVSSVNRAAITPDLPTLDETGVTGFDVSGWYGVVAPKGTPDSVIRSLNKAFTDAAHNPDITKQLNDYGYEIVASSPESFGNLINEEIAKWKVAVDNSGAKIQ